MIKLHESEQLLITGGDRCDRYRRRLVRLDRITQAKRWQRNADKYLNNGC